MNRNVEANISELISEYERKIKDLDALVESALNDFREDKGKRWIPDVIISYNSEKKCYLEFIENLKKIDGRL